MLGLHSLGRAPCSLGGRAVITGHLRKQRMNAHLSKRPPTGPSGLLTLAHLLECLERSPRADARQYRSVVVHLIQELKSVKPDETLSAVLDSYPAAAELYENLHYQHAGLCRSALEFALNAELRTRDVIRKACRAAQSLNQKASLSGEE